MTKKKKTKVNSGLHKEELKSNVKNNLKSKLLDTGILNQSCVKKKNFSLIIESAHNALRSVEEELDNHSRYHKEDTLVEGNVVKKNDEEYFNDNELLSESANRTLVSQKECNKNTDDHSNQNLHEFEKEKTSQRLKSLVSKREMSKSPILKRSNRSLRQNNSQIMNENEMSSIVNEDDTEIRTAENVPVDCLANRICSSHNEIKDIKQIINENDNVAFDNSTDFITDQVSQKSIKRDSSNSGKEILKSKLPGISEDSKEDLSCELSSLNIKIFTNTGKCEKNSDIFETSVKMNEISASLKTIEAIETNDTNSEQVKEISDVVKASGRNSKNATKSEKCKVYLDTVETSGAIKVKIANFEEHKLNSVAIETSDVIKENTNLSEQSKVNSDIVERTEAIKEYETNSEQFKLYSDAIQRNKTIKENSNYEMNLDVEKSEVNKEKFSNSGQYNAKTSKNETSKVMKEILARSKHCEDNSGTSEVNEDVTNSDQSKGYFFTAEANKTISQNVSISEQIKHNSDAIETAVTIKENIINYEQYNLNTNAIKYSEAVNENINNSENFKLNSKTVEMNEEKKEDLTNSQQLEVNSDTIGPSEVSKKNVSNDENCTVNSDTTDISNINNYAETSPEECMIKAAEDKSSKSNKRNLTNSEKSEYSDHGKVKSDTVELRKTTYKIGANSEHYGSNSDTFDVDEKDKATVNDSEQCGVRLDTIGSNEANNKFAPNSEQHELNLNANVRETNIRKIISEYSNLKVKAPEKTDNDNVVLNNSEQSERISKEKELICQSKYKGEFSVSHTKLNTLNDLLHRTNILNQSHNVKEIISEKNGNNINEDIICTPPVKDVPNRIIDTSNFGKVKGTNKRKLSTPRKHLLVQNLAISQPMRQLAIPKDKINRNRLDKMGNMNIGHGSSNNFMFNDTNSCSNSPSHKETLDKGKWKGSTFITPLSRQLETINTLEKIKNVSTSINDLLNKELYDNLEPFKTVEETNLEESSTNKEVTEKSNELVRIQSIQEKIRSRSYVEYKTLTKERESPLKSNESVGVEKEEQELIMDDLKTKKLPQLRSIYAPPIMTESNQRLFDDELEPKCKKLKTPYFDSNDEHEKNLNCLNVSESSPSVNQIYDKTIKIKQEIEEPPIKRRRLPPLRSIYDNKKEIDNKTHKNEDTEKPLKVDNNRLYVKEPNLLNNEENESDSTEEIHDISIKMEPIDLEIESDMEIESTQISDTLTDRLKNVQQDLDFKLDDFRYRVDCIMEEKERLYNKFEHVKTFLKSDVPDAINICTKSRPRNLRQTTVVNTNQSKSLKCHTELQMSTQNEWTVQNDDDEEIAWQVEDVQRIVEKIQIAKEKIHKQMLILGGHMIESSNKIKEKDLTNDNEKNHENRNDLEIKMSHENRKNPTSRKITVALQKIAKVRSQIQSYFTLDSIQNNFPETEESNSNVDCSDPIEDVILKEVQKVRKLVSLQDGVLHRANENILKSKERLRCQMSMMKAKLEVMKTEEGKILRNLLHSDNVNRKNNYDDVNLSELMVQNMGCKEVSSPLKNNMASLQSMHRLQNISSPKRVQNLSNKPGQISNLEEVMNLGNKKSNSPNKCLSPSRQNPIDATTNGKEESYNSGESQNSKQDQDLNIKILSVESLNQNDGHKISNNTDSENNYNAVVPIKQEKNSLHDKYYDKLSSTTDLPSPENCYVSEKVLKKCPVCFAKVEFTLNADKQMLTTQCICNLHILVLLDLDEDEEQKPTSSEAEERRVTRRSIAESCANSTDKNPHISEEVRRKDPLEYRANTQESSKKQEITTKSLKRNSSNHLLKRSSSLERTETPIFVSQRSSRSRSKTSLS